MINKNKHYSKECGKTAYETRKAAKRGIKETKAHGHKHKLSIYCCDTCGAYHLTSYTAKKKATRKDYFSRIKNEGI